MARGDPEYFKAETGFILDDPRYDELPLSAVKVFWWLWARCIRERREVLDKRWTPLSCSRHVRFISSQQVSAALRLFESWKPHPLGGQLPDGRIYLCHVRNKNIKLQGWRDLYGEDTGGISSPSESERERESESIHKGDLENIKFGDSLTPIAEKIIGIIAEVKLLEWSKLGYKEDWVIWALSECHGCNDQEHAINLCSKLLKQCAKKGEIPNAGTDHGSYPKNIGSNAGKTERPPGYRDGAYDDFD